MNADTLLRELVEQKQSCSDVDWAAAFEWADAQKAAPPAAQPDERKAFEAWAMTQPRHEGANMRFLGLNNAYIDFDLHGAWLAWQARAAQVEPASAPDGWVLVPGEPTVEMQQAAGPIGSGSQLYHAYKAMIAARPGEQT